MKVLQVKNGGEAPAVCMNEERARAQLYKSESAALRGIEQNRERQRAREGATGREDEGTAIDKVRKGGTGGAPAGGRGWEVEGREKESVGGRRSASAGFRGRAHTGRERAEDCR
eukprot:6214193-Pleurochrysis_carterae.AAC.2